MIWYVLCYIQLFSSINNLNIILAVSEWVIVAQLCATLWGHRLYPARLLCPWDCPGKNTGVGCHFLLQYWQCRHIMLQELRTYFHTLSIAVERGLYYWFHFRCRAAVLGVDRRKMMVFLISRHQESGIWEIRSCSPGTLVFLSKISRWQVYERKIQDKGFSPKGYGFLFLF